MFYSENVFMRKREREKKKIHSCGETAPVVFLRLNEMRRGTIDRREEAGSEVFFFFFFCGCTTRWMVKWDCRGERIASFFGDV